MDSEVSKDLLDRREDPFQLPLTSGNELSQTCNIAVINTKVTDLRTAVPDKDREASLVPITPEFNRESGECQHEFTSPLTFVPTPPKVIYHNSYLNNGPSPMEDEENLNTPKRDAFDPFAPGPDRFMLAPQCRKYKQESLTSVVRRLNFESLTPFTEADDQEADSGIVSDDKILFETVYRSLLEDIISMQAAEALSAKVESPPAEARSAEVESPPASGSDGFRTPTSAPHLSGVAETCPCAPVKPTNKFRNIDKSLCRKLEF